MTILETRPFRVSHYLKQSVWVDRSRVKLGKNSDGDLSARLVPYAALGFGIITISPSDCKFIASQDFVKHFMCLSLTSSTPQMCKLRLAQKGTGLPCTLNLM